MLVAALYDIHANLAALDAVLSEMAALRVDRVIVGGDVLPGPMPRGTLSRLSELDYPADFIQGNGEVAVLDCLEGGTARGVPEPYQPALRWVAEEISSQQADSISNWPKTLRFSLEGLGDVLFCHATPRDQNECFTELTGEEVLQPIFAETQANVVVCGHTHMQFERMIGNTLVVNAGSVGMPFGEPGADWLLLNGAELEFRHTAYDLEEAAERVRHTSYPGAEEFAARNILQPPTKQEMLKAFARAGIKK